MEGPPIMKDEIRNALRSMKDGKAAGPDNITSEMIKATDELGITKLHSLLNRMYDEGYLPADVSRSIFIALPKKPGAIDFEQKDEILELEVGAVIAANGYTIFDPVKIPEYRYRDLPNVVTAMEFERLYEIEIE